MTEGIDTAAAERLFFAIIEAVAELEHVLMSERTMDSLATARTLGRAGGQKPKLGPRQSRGRCATRPARTGSPLHRAGDRRRVWRQPADRIGGLLWPEDK